MGNYSDFETDFVPRTLALIDQYNKMIEVQGKPFREQYNYTLILNCLLGLIVLTKEKALSFLPADRLRSSLKPHGVTGVATIRAGDDSASSDLKNEIFCSSFQRLGCISK